MSQPVKEGDTISLHYTGKFENGEVFDSSEGKIPLVFTVGAGQLISGFDRAVVGMKQGERKSVTIEPEEAHGSRAEARMIDMPVENISKDMDLQESMMVQLSDQSGNPVPAQLVEVGDEAVKLDLNHPLAGKTLIFDIEIVETGLEPGVAQGCGCGCIGE